VGGVPKALGGVSVVVTYIYSMPQDQLLAKLRKSS